MITPYKNRIMDLEPEDPVEVYRNITKKGVVYSIRQGGYVVAHGTEINLVNAEFVVGQSGRKRVKKTGVKNVHAYIRGELMMSRGPASGHQFQVVYDPKRYKEFRRLDLRKPIKEARFVCLNQNGVWADNYVNL